MTTYVNITHVFESVESRESVSLVFPRGGRSIDGTPFTDDFLQQMALLWESESPIVDDNDLAKYAGFILDEAGLWIKVRVKEAKLLGLRVPVFSSMQSVSLLGKPLNSYKE